MSRALTSSRDGHVYEFAPTMEPVYEAADGESLTIETIDSLNGAIQTDDDRLDAIPEEVNAATGPIAVEGRARATCSRSRSRTCASPKTEGAFSPPRVRPSAGRSRDRTPGDADHRSGRRGSE